MENQSLKTEIERSLSTLKDREADIIRDFFGLGMLYGLTLEELSVKYDLTMERIRQIKEKALRRLRHKSKNALLKQYLG